MTSALVCWHTAASSVEEELATPPAGMGIPASLTLMVPPSSGVFTGPSSRCSRSSEVARLEALLLGGGGNDEAGAGEAGMLVWLALASLQDVSYQNCIPLFPLRSVSNLEADNRDNTKRSTSSGIKSSSIGKLSWSSFT